MQVEGHPRRLVVDEAAVSLVPGVAGLHTDLVAQDLVTNSIVDVLRIVIADFLVFLLGVIDDDVDLLHGKCFLITGQFANHPLCGGNL